jgi:hypothetical protein
MATTPTFTGTPICGIGQVSTANVNRDGTGALNTVLTAGANGTRVFRIHIKATGTTTAGMLRLFVFDGTNARLFREYVVTAITVGAAVKSWDAEEAFYDLVLPVNYILKASTHNAETFNVIAFGGNF